MRILIVSHAPLTAQFGASQLAINLSEALGAQGHDVTLWSPRPLPQLTRWWRTIHAMRHQLDDFLNTQQPFDVIDCPPTLVTPNAARKGPIVARSTQPDLLYLRASIGLSRARSLKGVIRLPFEYAHTLYHIGLVLRGWQRASRIMCLGTIELKWMKRWFPWWRSKLVSYFCAPSAQDQRSLAEIRSRRKLPTSDSLRFLWIGRWTAHKGTDRLLEFIEKWIRRRPNDTFTIAGSGPEAEADCPDELLRSGQVKIISSFAREELYEILATHDVGLFTSKVEGWGLSLNEMLESGMPVFATHAGAVEDLKPFFKTLKPFPPPHNVELINGEQENLTSYYNTFSWSDVARNYSESIATPQQQLATSSA